MSTQLRGAVLVMVAALCFGTLSYVSRSAEALGLATLAFVWWRAAIAALALGAGLAATRLAGSSGPADRSLPADRSTPFDRRGLFALTGATLAGATLNFAIFAAFSRVSVAVALIVFYTYPAIVTLGAARLFGERLDARRAVALGVASVGLLLVILGPIVHSADVRLDPLGMGLAFLAALAQSVYVLLGARGFPSVPALHASTVIVIGSALIYGVVLALGGALGSILVPFERPGLWAWVLAAGLVGAAIPSTALLVGIRSIGPSRAAILMTLEPVAGVLIAALLLGEQPVPLQLLGGAAVLAAGAVLQLPSRAQGRLVPPAARAVVAAERFVDRAD